MIGKIIIIILKGEGGRGGGGGWGAVSTVSEGKILQNVCKFLGS